MKFKAGFVIASIAFLAIGLVTGILLSSTTIITQTTTIAVTTEKPFYITQTATRPITITSTKVMGKELTTTITEHIIETRTKYEVVKVPEYAAKCRNGYCPIESGFLYLVTENGVIPLYPKGVIEGIPYVELPKMDGKVGYIVWRSVIDYEENESASVAHIFWIKPAEGEVLKIFGSYYVSANPFRSPVNSTVRILVTAALFSPLTTWMDREAIIEHAMNLDKYLPIYLAGLDTLLSVGNVTLNPFCELCAPYVISIEVDRSSKPAESTDPRYLVELAKDGLVIYSGSETYSALMTSLTSAAMVERHGNSTIPPIVVTQVIQVAGEPI